MSDPLRFAVLGAGFWSRYQLAAWGELDGAECVAVCDPDRAKAEARAREFGVPSVYDTPEALFDRERLDFVDIISSVESHAPLVRLASDRKVAVICQKPLTTSYEGAEALVEHCRAAGVPLFVHENFRWQHPVREFKRVLDAGRIGRPFRARLDFNSGFPVFDNQPALRAMEQFIIADLGVHVLDIARFFFGEAAGVFCRTQTVRPDIKGEDVATIVLAMRSGATVTCTMAYAGNPLEHDRFPETFAFVEASAGSAELGPDFWIRETTAEGTLSRRCPPPRYDWADPAYDVAHASMVPTHANILSSLRGEGRAETTGQDNLRTLQLVYESYRSAREHRYISLD